MLHTTLKLCKENDACRSGYKTLKKSLPEDHKEGDLIPLTHVIESNSLDDALWVLSHATFEECDYFKREFAIWCARSVLHIWEKEYPHDNRVKNCINAAEKINNKEVSEDELKAAAWAATRAAAWATRAADRAAAWAASDAAGAAQEKQLIKMLENHK